MEIKGSQQQTAALQDGSVAQLALRRQGTSTTEDSWDSDHIFVFSPENKNKNKKQTASQLGALWPVRKRTGAAGSLGLYVRGSGAAVLPLSSHYFCLSQARTVG